MDGRRAGTPGGDLAARRLADWLEAAGLRPGGERESFFQSFVVAPGARVGDGLDPAPGGRRGAPGRARLDATRWLAAVSTSRVRSSSSATGSARPHPATTTGRAIDVRDRIALALDGAPAHLGGLRDLAARQADRRAPRRRARAADRRRPRCRRWSATATAVRLVSGTLTPAAADTLLAPDASIARLTTTLAERRAPASFVAARRVEVARRAGGRRSHAPST